ncbi:MAG: hypothetical protein D6796_14270 [Caldilineae bacterium]|nr:MAG: hypothetical protein D6796_14270 [Caldilineae bacterium]
MTTEYPDVIGEYVFAPKRFEVDGLQYVGVFEPPAIRLGETSRLLLYLQNTLNVPLKVEITPSLPQTGRFRAQPILRMEASKLTVQLAEAEVGVLIIPVTTTEHARPGEHALTLEFKVQHSRNVRRIRKPRDKNPLQGVPIDNPVGLDLVSVLGATYSIQKAKKGRFSLTISGEAAEATEVPSLRHAYKKLWELELAQQQHDAQLAVNEARVQILDALKVEPLFVALYVESQRRFLDSALPLRVGEAIALAKLLTYTVHLFLSNAELQNGLLCPIWQRAMFNEYPTTDILPVIRDVGYRHIIRLATALSFGLVAKAHGQQPWSVEERRGVTDYIADALEEGEALDPNFLYLPLMMGAVTVIRQVHLPDEDVGHTLQLLQTARRARTELFADEDLQIADQIFDRLLQRAMSQT